MKSNLVIASLFVGALGQTNTFNTKCAANNCARAVTGTVKGTAAVAARMADCSSFMRTTVTPATSTYTTISSTTRVVYSYTGTTAEATAAKRDLNNGPAKRFLVVRQATGSSSSVPTYATSACTRPSQYSSACSCYGITAATITAAPPSTTTTSTTTVTATSTVAAGTCGGQLCPAGQQCVNDQCYRQYFFGQSNPPNLCPSPCYLVDTQPYGYYCVSGTDSVYNINCQNNNECGSGEVCNNADASLINGYCQKATPCSI